MIKNIILKDTVMMLLEELWPRNSPSRIYNLVTGAPHITHYPKRWRTAASPGADVSLWEREKEGSGFNQAKLTSRLRRPWV